MKKLAWQFFKYGLISVVSYSFIFGGTYLLTDLLKVSASISYFIVISLSYIYLYYAGSSMVFTADRTPKTMRLFLIHICVFWILNNALFNVILHGLEIHYLLAIVINIGIFAPLRFLSLRYFVFHNKSDSLTI